MPEPFLAPCLVNLRQEIDRRWPTRSRASDGWVGDRRHQGEESDHNPDANGLVRALDVTVDGIRAWPVIVAVTHHPSTWYVIHNRLIFSRTHHWRPVEYDGANPHTEHFHVSIQKDTNAALNPTPWLR